MIDGELSSQDHIKDTDVGFDIEVVAFPFVQPRIDNIDLDVEISDMMS